MRRRRNLAAGAKAKTRRGRRKRAKSRMTNEDARLAKTGRRKMIKRSNRKTEAKKEPKTEKRRNRRRWKRRRMENESDPKAKKRVAMFHGDPDLEAVDHGDSHETEAATGDTAAAETEKHPAAPEAETEPEAETQKTETGGRAQMIKTEKHEDETAALKNGPLRNSAAESERIDRRRLKTRATLEAATLTAINARKEKQARAPNQKREQRTNRKARERMRRKRTPLLATATENQCFYLPLFSRHTNISDLKRYQETDFSLQLNWIWPDPRRLEYFLNIDRQKNGLK